MVAESVGLVPDPNQAMQVLWLLVLAKFVTPAMLPVPILPAPIHAAASSAKSAAAKEGTVAVLDALVASRPSA